MKLLHNLHRQFLNHWNFSKENRLVFENGGQEQPEPEVESEEKTEQTEEHKPLKELIEDAKGKHKELGKKFKELATKYEQSGEEVTDAERDILDKFHQRITEINKEHQKKLEQLKDAESPKKQAAEAMHPDVENLITEINEHVETAGETLKKDFIETNLSTLTDRLADLPGFGKFDKDNPQLQEVATLALMQISQKKLEAAKKEGKLEISAEEEKKIKKVMMENIQKSIDPKDTAEKHELTLLDNWADELDLPYEDELEEGEPLNKIIALKFLVEKGDKENEIKLDGDPVKNKEELMTKIELEDSELAKKLTAYKKATENDNMDEDDALEALEKYADNTAKAHEAMQKLADALSDTEAVEKMGLGEALGALLQLWGAIKVALDSGDWATLNEVMDDFTKGRNPAKRMKESRDSYANALEGKTPPLNDLLKAYMDPRGNEGDKLFAEGAPEDKKEALGRYRMEAKPAIQDYLVAKLPLNSIAKIEETTGGITEMTAYNNNGDKIAVELLVKTGQPTKARVVPYVQGKNEKGETVEGKAGKKEELKEVEDLKALEDLITKNPEVAKEKEKKEKKDDKASAEGGVVKKADAESAEPKKPDVAVKPDESEQKNPEPDDNVDVDKVDTKDK